MGMEKIVEIKLWLNSYKTGRLSFTPSVVRELEQELVRLEARQKKSGS